MEESDSSSLHLPTSSPPPPPHIDDLLAAFGISENAPESSLFPVSSVDRSSHSFRENSELSVSSQLNGVESLLMPQTSANLDPPNLVNTADDEAPDVRALLGTSSGFNVTNFLDGILNETAQPQNFLDGILNEAAHTQVKPADKPKTIVTEANGPFLASAKTNPVGVPLDPWNSLGYARSNPDTLASIIGRIQGIDVEATALQGQEVHSANGSSVIAGIPLSNNAPSLLTPSALQGINAQQYVSVQASVVNGTEENQDDFLGADSFYNQLLGED